MKLVYSKKLVLGVALSLVTLTGQLPINTAVANAQAVDEAQGDGVCHRPQTCQTNDANKSATPKYDGYQRLSDIIMNIIGED